MAAHARVAESVGNDGNNINDGNNDAAGNAAAVELNSDQVWVFSI